MDTKDTAQKISDTAKQAEGAIDDVVWKATAKVGEALPDNAKKTAQDVVNKAHEFAGKVDNLTWKVDEFADSILPAQSWTDVEFQPQWNDSISRVFIIRLLWIIIQYPIIAVRWFITFFATIINRVYMLVTWSRNRFLRNGIVRYYRHFTKRSLFIAWIIDKRPEIIEK